MRFLCVLLLCARLSLGLPGSADQLGAAARSAGSLEKRQSANLGENDFYWSYSGTASNSTLRQCSPITVTWDGGPGTTGRMVPPYYLVAVPIGGSPTQIALGSGNTGSFTLPFRQGTQFTMGIVDSQGDQGGFEGLLNVIAGASSSCISVPNSPVNLAVNTTNVAVCSYLGAQVSGGNPPYTFTVVPAGSIARTTNLTLNAGNNYFGYVAADNSNTQLLVAARDSVGNWAPTSPIIYVTGSNAELPNCNGLANFQSNGPPGSLSATSSSAASTTSTATSSSSGNTPSLLPAGTSPASTTSPSSSSSNAGAIAGGVAGGVLGAALFALLAFCFYRRKRRTDSTINDSQAIARPSMGDDMSEYGHGERAFAAVTPFDLSDSSSSPRHSAFMPPPSGGGRVGTPLGSARAEDSSVAGTLGHEVPMEGSFRLANPDEEHLSAPLALGGIRRYGSEGHSASSTSAEGEKSTSRPEEWNAASGPVTQHRDAGRIHEDDFVLPNEVAPAYTDLSRDPSTSRRRL